MFSVVLICSYKRNNPPHSQTAFALFHPVRSIPAGKKNPLSVSFLWATQGRENANEAFQIPFTTRVNPQVLPARENVGNYPARTIDCPQSPATCWKYREEVISRSTYWGKVNRQRRYGVITCSILRVLCLTRAPTRESCLLVTGWHVQTSCWN